MIETTAQAEAGSEENKLPRDPMCNQEAQANWQRYEYGRLRGHRDYCQQAAKCERYYLGGGLQWSPEDRAILDAQQRPAYEFNEILPSCNSAIGYQIHNRMNIAFKPRGGQADQMTAEAMTKIAMQVTDNNKLHWLETQVFSDGVIQQRGYYDIRMDWSKSMMGTIKITDKDPLDVIPDPDAKSYDPDGWSDVIITGWITYDEIEEHYGFEAMVKVKNTQSDEHDFGDNGEDTPHNKFGNSNSGAAYDSFYDDGQYRRVRIVERQKYVYVKSKVGIWPETGDIRLVEGCSPQQIQEFVDAGVTITQRMMRRIRWTISTQEVMLHSDWSPYDHFTIVPYFAYFRRGKTIGMIDNAIGPQDALNKSVSQFVHIINTSANSGWVVEQNSLTNMKTEDLATQGAKTGLTLEYKKGSTKPEKIQPNQIPTGVDRLIDRATNALKDVTVPEAMRGVNSPEVSGIAIQSKQFASQQQLAVPLENLAHTRHLLADRMMKLKQKFYTAERTFRITEMDPISGKPREQSVSINRYNPATGRFDNDLTQGEYDVVITEQPMAATFGDTQFTQGLELRKNGVNVPDAVLIRHSNLTDKEEILSQMTNKQPDPVAKAEADLLVAKAQLTLAQAQKAKNDAVSVSVQGMFSATQAANTIAMNPAVAPLADELLKSAGAEDHNAAPLVPNAPPGTQGITMPHNTSPLFPAHADTGMNAGIEGGRPNAVPAAPAVTQ
jgi:hypothetical protein